MSKIAIKWHECPIPKLRAVWNAWQKEHFNHLDEESLIHVNRQWVKGDISLLVDENLLLAETLQK